MAARKLLLRCSFCNHVNFQGSWLDVTEAANRVLDQELPLQVCYAVCDGCQSVIRDRCFVPLRDELPHSDPLPDASTRLAE